MAEKLIRSALISVYNKDGLEPLARALHAQGVTLYSTGGTQSSLMGWGLPVIAVEDLTGYPSILDGRVKTLHPKVFGGILARREAQHQAELARYSIPELDLVIVDLYPFEDTVAETDDETTIIEKIDIGGIALIRAAAKNYRDLVIISSKDHYAELGRILEEQNGKTTLDQRRSLARKAFGVSSRYDTAIYRWFSEGEVAESFRATSEPGQVLRYGENPHQTAVFYGPLNKQLYQIQGKEISYNNLVDIDAAMALMSEFKDDAPTFAVLKHTNSCGLATRESILDAWEAALAGDPVSAFGGILISNRTIDRPTAEAIDKIFYEVLLAPDFTEEALEVLTKKKKRILLRINDWSVPTKSYRRLLHGVIEMDTDLSVQTADDLTTVTKRAPNAQEVRDLLFANRAVKHIKSNAIALVKDQQLIGMGSGQTSRVDALRQAIDKARRLGFDVTGAVMASDAFFPFPDCVELAYQAGMRAVIQPGGSIRDQDSIDYCDEHDMAMVTTGIRHFRH